MVHYYHVVHFYCLSSNLDVWKVSTFASVRDILCTSYLYGLQMDVILIQKLSCFRFTLHINPIINFIQYNGFLTTCAMFIIKTIFLCAYVPVCKSLSATNSALSMFSTHHDCQEIMCIYCFFHLR